MSGFSRVSIPDNLRRTIQDIREITGKHSDDDIYAALKECNMDSNETAQKLLYLDTFEEVKRKRDRRKVSVFSRAHARQIPAGMQRRGTKGYNNHYSSYNSDDAVSGRRQENGTYRKAMGRASKSSKPVLHKVNNKVPTVASSIAASDGSTSVCNGSFSHESTATQSADQHSSIRGITKDTKGGGHNIIITSRRKSSSLRPVTVKKQLTDLDPGPTPTSTPTNPSSNTVVVSRARIPGGGSLKLKSSRHLVVGSVSVSGVYSCASDPVLVPSLNPRNSAGAVGIIKGETRNQSKADESSHDNLIMDDIIVDPNVKIGQAVVVSSAAGSVVDQLHPIESHLASQLETCSLQQVNGPNSKQASEPDIVKLHICGRHDHECVILPKHLHVPESFKNSFTFGSLDPCFLDQCPRDASVPTNNIQAFKKQSSPPTSPDDKSSSPISGQSPEYPDEPVKKLTPSSSSSSQENISSDLRYDDQVQPGVGRCRHEDVSLVVTPATPDHLVQPQACMFPLYPPRLQPNYSHNYVPYHTSSSPYSYMPPAPHQLLLGQGHTHTHTGFPSAANSYMPTPPAAAPPPPPPSGAKFPMYKPGNMTHLGTHDDQLIKEKNIKQEEDLNVLTSASGRDTSAFYYNLLLPQGQAAHVGHMMNSFPAAAIYHQSFHQPTTTDNSIVSYPHPHLVSLPQQQYGQQQQMNWNQKLFN